MKKILLVATLAGVIAICLYSGYVLTRPEKTIALGEPIYHDDFAYSVEKVEKLKTIYSGDHLISAEGTFYVVTLKVANNAVRVNHRWDISMAYVEDETGKKYGYAPEAQKLWDDVTGIRHSAVHNTPKGVVKTANIVFDLPESIQNPCLKIWKDVLLGDVIDGGAYRKTKVSLD